MRKKYCPTLIGMILLTLSAAGNVYAAKRPPSVTPVVPVVTTTKKPVVSPK